MAISLSNTDRLSIISNLGTLLSAGIPILEAVDSLLEDAKGNQKKILTVLRDDLNQGKTISASLARNPKAFDPVTVNLIKASEQSGTLDETLKDVKINIKKDIEFNSKVKSALTYPILVFVVFAGVMLVILTFVIPRISEVFSRLNVTLPLATRVLILLSNLVLNYSIILIILLIALVLLALYLYQSNRAFIFQLFFSLPLLSKLAKLIDLTRFTRSFALLLSSGIPITEALVLSQDVVLKKEIKNMIKEAQIMVGSGKRLSDVFKKYRNNLPSLMIRVTEAGEKTGSLDKSMQEMAEHFDSEVTDVLRTVTALLEPILLVVMGLLVGGMMMAIISPIYQLIGNVGQR